MGLEMANGKGTSSSSVREVMLILLDGHRSNHAGEEDFDPVNSKKRTKSGKQDKQPRGRKEEREIRKISARSLSCDFQYEISGDISCLVVFVSYGFKQQLFIMRLFSLL